MNKKEKNKEYQKKYRNTNYGRVKVKERMEEYQKSPNGVFSIYQANARRRFLLWDLSFEEFMMFWQKPCSYCGDKIKTIGLDRIDSGEGYNINNVVPCCTKCNKMKSLMHRDEFLNYCRKIIANYNLYND